MTTQLRAALTVFVLLTVLTGAVYPALVTLVAQGVFPHQANGSVLERENRTLGSELIGQHFDAPQYFWGRPSATSPTPYNAASSSGSNLGPTNAALLDAVRERVEKLRQAHPDQADPVPVELVTASGSGLDPHISPAAVEYQVTRVARAMNLSPSSVRQLVAEHVEERTFGMLGEPRVNVLRLNLALDDLIRTR